jgi:hypothetical protein
MALGKEPDMDSGATGATGARIVLTRVRTGWRDRFRSYVVMLDGQEVGHVKRGERLEFTITPGRHQVFLKIDWCRSRTVEVDAGSHDVIEMTCAPGGSPHAGLGDVVTNTDGYITLTLS